MTCDRCGRKSETKFRHLGNPCKKCFFYLLEKRIKRVFKEERIKKNDKILILDSLSEYFFKRIMTMPLVVVKMGKSFFGIKEIKSIYENKKLNDFAAKNKINKIIIPWTLDHEVSSFLGKYFKNIKEKENKRFIKIFKGISEEELILFSRLKKISYKKIKKNDENKFLDIIEKKYPGTKSSLIKSIEKLRAI